MRLTFAIASRGRSGLQQPGVDLRDWCAVAEWTCVVEVQGRGRERWDGSAPHQLQPTSNLRPEENPLLSTRIREGSELSSERRLGLEMAH